MKLFFPARKSGPSATTISQFASSDQPEEPPTKRQRWPRCSAPSKPDEQAVPLSEKLEREILLLKRDYYRNKLEYQVDKKAALSKFCSAMDEFRQHVAEQRMVARGINVNDVPLELPPGMESFADAI